MLGCLLHAPRGPFYSPKAARSRWRPTWKAILAFCRVAHRTVWCTTGQPLFMSGVRFPSIPSAADRCNSGLVGAPDTVRCTPDSPVPPADRWRGPCVARGLRGRPLVSGAHRTVRCPQPIVGAGHASPADCAADRCAGGRWLTGQFGAPLDSPVNYSRTPPKFPESGLFAGVQPGAPDTVRCTTGQSGVPDRAESWLFQPSHFLVLFSLILALRQIY
jgi:hypothetical protein